MHSVWEIDRETNNRKFVAVFKDLTMAELFLCAVVEPWNGGGEGVDYEIVEMEPGEGR